MLKVVIIGYGEMFTNLIAAALDAKCEIVGVLRKETVKYPAWLRKIKDIICPSLEHNYIRSYNLPEITGVKGVNDEVFRKKLLKLNPDIILVGSWGEKFEKATYDIPKIAAINAHPSLLPKYRGPNPYFWVIKNQELESGISLHLIDEGYDTGAILAQDVVKIYPSDTGKSLKDRTVLSARGLCCELLKDLSEDVIIPLTQREDRATYYSYPEDLELNFSKKTAEENLAVIRAIYPWGRTWFYHDITALTPNHAYTCIEENKTKYKEAGTVVDVQPETRTISVLCSDGRILKMSNLELYKKQDKPFTKYYILRDIHLGDVI